MHFISSNYLKHAVSCFERKIYLLMFHTRMGQNNLIKNLNPQALPDKKKENLITAIYIGAVFILLAVIYFANLPSNLWDSIVKFFSSLTLAQVPGTAITLPAPAIPDAHLALYLAAFQLALGIGILEIAILTIRIMLHSPISRKAETVENIVFWLGASYLVITYLVNMTIMTEWFVFWAGIVLIAGLSLVARAFVLLARR
jgi:hypothetical protein